MNVLFNIFNDNNFFPILKLEESKREKKWQMVLCLGDGIYISGSSLAVSCIDASIPLKITKIRLKFFSF